ncbi:MAG: hypothetical protein II453_03055 [Alphaproteobacteria bacterium]|nr:hypothetical protein [Alphaproteobacteria bacterium]MBQ2396441.1 hypothetical protein [Bacteroidales bacterium]
MAEYIDEELKTIEVKDSKGNVIESKDFYISKFPAVLGREIMMRYSTTMANINDDYARNEDVMRKILKFARVELPDGRKIALESESLINNHVPDGEMLSALEQAILAHNFSFFRDGEPSD